MRPFKIQDINSSQFLVSAPPSCHLLSSYSYSSSVRPLCLLINHLTIFLLFLLLFLLLRFSLLGLSLLFLFVIFMFILIFLHLLCIIMTIVLIIIFYLVLRFRPHS